RHSLLLYCLLAAVAAHVTYNCGGKGGRSGPCDAHDASCETECHTSEYCQKKKGNNWFCNQAGPHGGCCEQLPRWENFECGTLECNSHAYCIHTWKRGSRCNNGCCAEIGVRRNFFNRYTCNGQRAFNPCVFKSCRQECHTTQHCQKLNGPGSFCHAQTGCCTDDAGYGKLLPATCDEAECNSHDFCSTNFPGSHCNNGCCTVNVDPIPEIIVSPGSGFGREGREVTYCKDLHADIVLVIDASGSITAPIFNSHTKRFAKAVIERFDVGTTRTRIGIVAYSATVYYKLSLTECSDVACLLSAIDSLSYASGGTCTGEGIAAATEMLAKMNLLLPGETHRSRAIIVITDGHEECGYGPSTVTKRCNEARAQDIDLYAVAVGTKTFYTKPAAIADLDAICGGDDDKRFVAENYEALDSVFVERLQRQVCSTTWQVYGRCVMSECYTDSFCGKLQRGSVCRGGCCIDGKTEIPDPIITNECTFMTADVILVIDGSGSITAPIFNTHTKSFVKELISRFTIGFMRTRVGIVAYASSVYYTVSLEECADQYCLISKIDNLNYPAGGTCTGNAIATATDMFEFATSAEGIMRPKVMIVITDGHEECGGGASTVSRRSEAARAAGIDLFAVAVGTDTFLKKPAAVADLKAISNGDDSRQFIAKDYASLDYSFVDNLQREVCTTTAIGTIDKSETCEVECRTTAYCRRKDSFTECSNGCCVPSWKDWDERKIIRPPRAITYCYGLHADIVLVIDASGSITAPIFNSQTKMFAKSLVARFDVGPLKTRIGIVAYAASVYYTQDVTECYDVSCLYARIDQLSYPAGGTCTGNAIAKATDILAGSPTPNFYERNRARVIIVITDGHEECGGGATTVPSRCNAAREDDIELYAVAVGDTFRNKPAAIADLNAIADNDENNKFLANDYNALDSSFIERMQREVCSTEFRRWGRENCEQECRTDAFCGRLQAGSICRRGCCVAPEVIIPVEPIFVAECKYASVDVVLVIDASGSITAPIFNKHTKNFAKELIDRFVVSPTRTRVGLVAYAASVYMTQGLTVCSDRGCLKSKIDSLTYPAGGTCTGDAIAKATELLLAANSPDGIDRPRIIIVITDGHEECGRGGSTVPKQCNAARAKGIDLFAVAVGTDTFLTKPAAVADVNAICNNQDDHKFIAKDYESLDYAFVDDLQREVCSTTVKTGLKGDCQAECSSHMQCAYFASGTKCVNGCCKPAAEPHPGCVDKKETKWCEGTKNILVGGCQSWAAGPEMRRDCPKTCGVCKSVIAPEKPKCVDKKSASWCKSNIGNCHRGPYQARMRCGCAATCGFCSTDGGTPPPTPSPVVGKCIDSVMDCGAKSGLCQNKNFKNKMLQRCAATCGYCSGPVVTFPPVVLPPITTAPPAGACADDTPYCANSSSLCALPQYVSICKRTCGGCGEEPPLATSPPVVLPPITTAPPTVSTCVDTATDCGIKSGLCHNNAYKSLMMRRCKRTCGWCAQM
ncbi:hypothetical protein PMAYCL1PPCAC_11242, partial [Pristionchus mayeri]